MRKFVLFLPLLLALSVPAGLALAGHESMFYPYDNIAFGQKTMMPLPEAGDLRQHIIGQEPYKNWKMWPGRGKHYEGTEPHGALLTTYVNDIALRSIESTKGMENNAIIVKENYTPDKKLVAITVMYKVKGYNPDGGDWFWAKYDPAFAVQAEGKAQACLSCHTNAKQNDYIFTGKVTK